jgi:predicted transcriptional regulator
LIVQESQIHVPWVISLLGATLTLPGQQDHFEDDLRRALGQSVSEVMTDEPVVCRDTDTLERAATLMHDHHVSRLPVVRGGSLVGIVSRGDILRAILASE